MLEEAPRSCRDVYQSHLGAAKIIAHVASSGVLAAEDAKQVLEMGDTTVSYLHFRHNSHWAAVGTTPVPFRCARPDRRCAELILAINIMVVIGRTTTKCTTIVCFAVMRPISTL
jgi:hypothetical protein